MKPLPALLLALAAVAAAAPEARAQAHQRWKLDYTPEKPQLYTYRDSLDRLENYWFLVYKLENRTKQVIPLLVDVMMYTEAGRELQTDLRKVDPDVTKEPLEDPNRYEPLKFGTFHPNLTLPLEVEHRIIEYHAKLGNRSPGIVRESIEELKKGDETHRYYLNPRELRQQKFIRPGQTITGLAVFRNVDPKADLIEVHVSGLWDVLRIDRYFGESEELEDVKIAYENRVLKYSYRFPGDEFERERDVLILRRQPQWVVKHIGPVASKSTIDSLLATLLRVLQKWDDLEKENATPADIEKEIAKFNLTPMDFSISARVIGMALGDTFSYDHAKSLVENKRSLWRMHEWWVANKHKLAFNEETGRYEVREEILPGQLKD